MSYDLAKKMPNHSNHLIDLRSDTVTKPTNEMRKIMADAEVGDDVYGEDPTINRLEKILAERLGKEAGVLMTSGTQSNLCSVLTHCARGEEVIIGNSYHIYIDEAAGASVLGGVAIAPIETGNNSELLPENIAKAVKPDDLHCPISKLVCMENTVWGEAIPLDKMNDAKKEADAHNLSTHLDGARFFNAITKLGCTATELANCADTVSICLSKGLGTPAGSVLLAAILLKLGSYGFVRIALPILPEQAKAWAPAIAILSAIGIIYGSLACLAQTDLKRLIAFSSVGHMGFVMLGISSLTSIGINAAMIGMVAHGIITGLLFFISGSMAHTYHTRDMGRLGGNMKLLPKTGALLGFTAMASLGLPGLAGFWGEFMALLGAYNPLSGLNITVFRTSMVAGAIGTVLTAGYLLWMLQRVNLGEPKEEWIGQDLHDADNYELAAWIPLVILTVLIGVFPKLIFGSTNDAVINLVTKAFGG